MKTRHVHTKIKTKTPTTAGITRALPGVLVLVAFGFGSMNESHAEYATKSIAAVQQVTLQDISLKSAPAEACEGGPCLTQVNANPPVPACWNPETGRHEPCF